MKKFIILIIFLLLMTTLIIPLSAQEIYPTNVMLTIRLKDEVISRVEIFEILDMEDYILIPLVSLSRWVDIDINYIRENDLLTIYYEEKDKNIQINLENEIYYDQPDWSTEPPVTLEGDFYVTTKLIEYLTEARVDWQPRNQEVILDFNYLKETEVKIRPENLKVQPEITDKDFTIGSIHYKFGFDYELDEDSNDRYLFNNLTAIHGRASNWTYSAEQELEYDYEAKEYEIVYPLLRARNYENERFIALGDNKFRLTNTLESVDLRGLYLQYPIQQLSERRTYTSVRGEAKEGSTIELYVNERKIEEQYIYQGEDSYYFKNVPLTINRTNLFRIVITNLEGKETEIVKKVAGSLNIYEEGTNQGIFAAGRYRKDDETKTFLNVGGLQIKYAHTANTSLLWELGTERITDNSSEDSFEGGSVARIALRSKDLPLVFFVDWLAGSEFELIEHGVRASTLYTREDSYINVSYSYVPPVVADYVEADEGLILESIYEKELNENWLVILDLQNTKSISDMDDLDLSVYNIAFDYSDRARNKFMISTEVANRHEENKWSDLDLTEISQQSFDILLDGKTYRGETIVAGEVNYNLADINFYDEALDTNLTKQRDYTSLELDLSRNISDNITLISNFESEFTWIEGSKFERESEIELKTRLKTSDNTTLIGGISNRDEYDKDEEGNVNNEQLQELELFLNYNLPSSLNFTAGLKNTYLEEESYLSSEASLSYYNKDNDWELDIDFEYIGPYGSRETSQENISVEVSRYLLSGLEGFLRLERDYKSSSSEEPVYEASIYFSQALGFADGYYKFQKYEGQEHEPYIAGVVYLDENGNKKKDPEEPLLDNISMALSNSKTTTDQKGEFIFENVREGIHEIGFNSKELPAGYQAVTENKVLEVRENENLFFEMGLTKLGEVTGQILLEINVSNEELTEKISLNNVGIKIEELNRIVFSKNDGSFTFRDIPLGSYKIKIMESSLPKEVMVKGENIYEINITQEKISDQKIKMFLLIKI